MSKSKIIRPGAFQPPSRGQQIAALARQAEDHAAKLAVVAQVQGGQAAAFDLIAALIEELGLDPERVITRARLLREEAAAWLEIPRAERGEDAPPPLPIRLAKAVPPGYRKAAAAQAEGGQS